MLCDIDGSILSNSKSVYNHNKVHLNDDHHCEICYKTFSTLEFLKKHKKRTHTDAVYQCNECNEQFKVQYNLKRHIVNIHLNIEKTCDLCSQKFRPDNLKRHKEICSRGLKTNEADEEEMMDFFYNDTGGYQNSFKQCTK